MTIAAENAPPAVRPAPPARPRLPHLAAVSAYVLLGVVVMGRFAGRPGERVSAHLPIDHTWFEWLLAHGAHVVAHGGNPLFSTAQNYPLGVNMMANTSVLGVTVPLAPLTMLLGPRATYVIWMILACAGTAATTYWVLQRFVVRSRAAAFAGGALAGFAPGVVHHANGQPNFVSNFLLPLIVAAVFGLGAGRRWLRDGVVLGLLVTWQLFINEELLLATALACGLATILIAVFRPAGARRRAPAFLRGLGVTAVVAGALCAYPIAFQFHGPQSFAGLPLFTHWGEDPVTYLTFSRDTLAGSPLGEAAQGVTEQNSWFGWPLTVVLLVLAVALWRSSVPARVATLVAAVFAVLSLGPVLRFGGEETAHRGPLGLLPEGLPLFDLLMPSRLTYVVIGAAVLLVAVAWDRLRPTRFLVAAALVPLIPTPVPAMPERPAPEFVTSGAWREYVRPGGTLVPVPLPSNWLGRDTLGWSAQARHEFAVPEGYFLGPGPDGVGRMGPATVSRTTQLVIETYRTRTAPALPESHRAAVRADLARWHGEAVVMRAEAFNLPLRSLVSQVYGPPETVRDVWLWKP
ncbi:glycosyltransferase 87 family protein [Actinoplanes sp. M2I2]|uniref:glycosyltransferase 87 family protein n=1 Tax=Actinoplanes sp. M2I2 TaxID=1734444 RepID=UPI00202005A3|nr:glycosyltransferase 87 family protein [Actinoplanes sp. M2I2]